MKLAASAVHRPVLAVGEEPFRRQGATAAGEAADGEAARQRRFALLTQSLRAAPPLPPPVVCELGCGTGELLVWLREQGRDDIRYIGSDASPPALATARARFPHEPWVELDPLHASEEALDALSCDFLIVNDLFTDRCGRDDDAMWALMAGVLQRMWPRARRGIAFNVLHGSAGPARDDRFLPSMDGTARLLGSLAGASVRMQVEGAPGESAWEAVKPDPVPSRPPRLMAYRPLLPDASRLEPWLRQIDSGRWYSNHGPLAAELEQRLGRRLGVGPEELVCAASGTAALAAGILATAGRATPERPLALCPANTFVGTASALQMCGYEPWLVDVDEATWQLDPLALARHPMLARAGVVVPVSAYGRAVPQAPWEAFRGATGVPVVIDGAAAFEVLLREPAATLGSVPVALSFHATKVFATGEGGALVARDPALVRAAFEALNFGFLMTRESRRPSMNGKMSEHHAAVGLASLEMWPRHSGALHAVAARYRAEFAAAGLADRGVTHPAVASSYVLFHAADGAQAARLSSALAVQGIESRLWYGRGLQHQPAFLALPQDPLPVTERLAPAVLGLPVAPDMTSHDVARVVAAIVQALTPAAA
jgi:dTDP-4-amino-4,6-dideoxygalactose transaminase